MCSLDPLEPPINPFCEGWKTGLILFSESMKLASVAENILYIVLVNPIGLQFSGLEGSPFLYSIIVFVLFHEVGICLVINMALNIKENSLAASFLARRNIEFDIPSLPCALR